MKNAKSVSAKSVQRSSPKSDQKKISKVRKIHTFSHRKNLQHGTKNRRETELREKVKM